MSLFDKLRGHPAKGKEQPLVSTPLVDGLFLPRGCTREGNVLIVLPEFSERWFAKYPEKREAVKQILVFLKQQYPAVGNFEIRK